MKLSVLKEDLSRILSYSSRFVNARAQLPILGNIMLVTKKQRLGVMATNLEVSLFVSIGAKVDEDGDITVPAKTLTELVANLKPGTLTLKTQKEQLEVTSDHFDGKIAALNSSDFPKIPQSVGEKAITIPVEQLVLALNKVLFAASMDETRPILTGILFWFKGKHLYLASSDGFRLSRMSLVLSESTEEQKVVLPKGGVQELVRILGDQTGNVKLSIGSKEKQVILAISDIVFSSRVLEGNFPDFEKIIPKESRINISLDKEEFLRAIKIAAIFARESANIVKLGITSGGVEVSAQSQKSGQQKNQLEAKVEGGEIEMTYNYRFLEEFLSSVEGEDLEISLTDVNSPGVFKDSKNPNFLHLIMPVKVQS